MTAGDGWKWMGENPSDTVEIDVSHDAAVNSMTIDNPSNCVALVSNLRLQDEDCSTAEYPHICTISYNEFATFENILKCQLTHSLIGMGLS